MEDEVQEIQTTLRRLENAVFGNPDDLKNQPGFLVEMIRMAEHQHRTNEILTELRADVKKVVWIVLAAVAAAVLSLVLRPIGAEAPVRCAPAVAAPSAPHATATPE